MAGVLQEPLTVLPGIGEKRAKLFEKINVETIGQLLSHFPRGYEDRRAVTLIAECLPDQPCGICGKIVGEIKENWPRPRFPVLKCKVMDGSGVCSLTFFNSSYLHGKIKEGDTFYFYGRVEGMGAYRTMNNPKLKKVEGKYEGSIEPIYPSCQGLSRYVLVSAVKGALQRVGTLPETLPQELRDKLSFCTLSEAYENIHFPKTMEAAAEARRRLVFEEFLTFQLGLFKLRSRRRSENRVPVSGADGIAQYCATLPFQLTGAQARALQDIESDLSGQTPMNRLVQGDVGSGKTAVAAAALYAVAKSGYQTAFMAPTEILARQHFGTLAPKFEALGVSCGLLLGSTTKKARTLLLEQLKEGELGLLIGTHALLEDRVEFARLGLVVTDEQHRFGVLQRAKLSAKGESPHLLVMSATPIPRTLALMMYGDLDISVIDELPPGRKEILTYGVGERKRAGAYGFIEKQLEAGRQAYFVCPLVEEGESELHAAQEYAKHLQEVVFPHRRVGCLYGKMKAKEKAGIMEAFSGGQLDILVSTTVIEVGVDVPNATVMVVENAERFGLSQLHQLRGRVGRGAWQSYCILFCNIEGELVRKRLEMMCKTNDGFKIAKFDLEQRGPGDFFGERQHGLPNFRIANLMDDMSVLSQAQSAAKEILSRDGELSLPEHRALAGAVNRLFAQEENIFN